ncbi:MAG: DUF3604 domain-containing protein [Myxococcota bacterium]|nr:DUF3604 domain-containing protein [Myxococcota bacterium]
MTGEGRTKNKRGLSLFASTALACLAGLAVVTSGANALATPRPACEHRDALRRPFFGDTHVHTTFSFDAWGQGTLGDPHAAYRFAKGETIGIQPYDRRGNGQTKVRLRRPLDFAVVTDHSDLLGETRICRSDDLPGHDSLVCRVVRRFPALGYILVNGHVYSSERPSRYSFCGDGGALCLDAAAEPWRITQEAAREHNDESAACRFTTFVGYEWTGMPGGNNIHRNVVFANDVVQDFPTTYIETPTAQGLWRSLIDECIDGREGCDAIAIPHNSNVSNGLIWSLVRDDGTPIDASDARLRARLETLVEVTQHKGDSECRVGGFGGEDELCAFETVRGARMQDTARVSASASFEAKPRVYTREALTAGLVEAERLGVNPFQFGLIGSTDTHLATPGRVDEDEHLGHAAGIVSARFGPPPLPDFGAFNPGGLAVLWAEENSRASLFAAMKRREAYGTSGPRMVVRFFGGWDFDDDLCGSDELVARGYAAGVPMGSELPERPDDEQRPPAFVVSALRDPGDGGVPSTPLQRIQIVKGWVENGEPREKVYDIAGKASDADVDLATCTPRGMGHDQLCSVWRDPDFERDQRAYYYARVVENPSCRWNQWVCVRAGVECAAGDIPDGLEACCDSSLPQTIQERAWTSPIWHTPAQGGEAP